MTGTTGGNGGKRVVGLGTGTSFNVTGYTGYQNFTVDNFFISTLNYANGLATTSMPTGDCNWSTDIQFIKSYDASTGILTCYGKSHADVNGSRGVTAICSLNAYLIY